MEERQVSIDGEPRALPDPFMVIATQNPVEYEGTYPLPEAQLDRFLLKLVLPLPERAQEIEVLSRHTSGFDPRDLLSAGLRARRAVAEIVPRLASSLPMLSSPLTPPCIPMMTMCPSGASAVTF